MEMLRRILLATACVGLLLSILLASPIAFELSDIFNDKSCLDAWQNPIDKWWHFIISLPLWTLVSTKLYKFREKFGGFDYALSCCVFIAYHFIKKY